MKPDRLDRELPSAGDFLDPEGPVLDLLEGRELVVVHDEETPDRGATSLGGRYVSGLIHLRQPADRVAAAVTDFSRHAGTVDLFDTSTVIEAGADRRRVRYEAEVEMAVLTLNAEFVLEYTKRADGEWLWSAQDGDLETYRGRIEVLPVDSEGTLLCITSRIDFSGASWLLDTVLWAQPDLQVTLPVTMAAIQLHGFHTDLGEDPLAGTDAAATADPSPPSVRKLGVDWSNLERLLDRGTLLLFHPRERVATSDGPHDLLYTTGLQRLNGSAERLRRDLSTFESYPEFIDQVERVTGEDHAEGRRTEWSFRLGLGLLSVPIRFSIDYRWRNDWWLAFELTDGHFDLIAGGLEWQELSDTETLYAITSGSYIDEGAPRLVRLAKVIPAREIFMGVTLSTVVLQKSKQWVERRTES